MEPIAVTGVGVSCAIGHTFEELVDSVRSGRVGIRTIEGIDTEWLPIRIAGEVVDLDPIAAVGSPRDISRADAFAIFAATQALERSGIDLSSFDPARVCVSVGTCQGNIADLCSSLGESNVGTSADAVARHLGVRASRVVVSNACAAGAAAIAVAVEKLLSGEVDVAIAGGTDELAFFTLAGFTVLSSLDDQPCSPYSRSAGLTVGEGAGILVLERQADARRRQAPVLAHLIGYGLSADGYHPTAPDPTGRGGALAMARALESGGLDTDRVDYINGHGTGTSANDGMEYNALRALFGHRAESVPMSSTKSMIGHLLGAAGAVEAITAMAAITEGFLPPTAGVPDGVVAPFNCVPNVAEPAQVAVAMSNNYAFGGSNASLLFAGPDAGSTDPGPSIDHHVVVTGIGAVSGAGIGIGAWTDALMAGTSAIVPLDESIAGVPGLFGVPLPPLTGKGFAAPAQWRKMDELGRICVMSSLLAWRDARLELTSKERENVGLILATASGSLDVTMQFEAGARKGKGEANPKDFPHTSMNSAAGHACTTLGIHGPMLSISNGGTASFTALAFATDLVRRGVVDRILVTAADELSPAIVRVARSLGIPLASGGARPFDPRADGTCLAAASVTLLLESEQSAARRGAVPYGDVRSITTLGATADEDTFTVGTWVQSIHTALERAGVAPDAVGYAAAAAAGVVAHDEAERAALVEVFGNGVAVGAPKALFGETMGAAGLVNSVAALVALRTGKLAPQPMWREDGQSLDTTPDPARLAAADVVLANCEAHGSGVATAVFGRMDGER